MSLYAWWLQCRKLQVKFKVSPASLQTFIDTGLILTPSVIPNSNYVIMVSDRNCFKYVCMFFYTGNHQVYRYFWSSCTRDGSYCRCVALHSQYTSRSLVICQICCHRSCANWLWLFRRLKIRPVSFLWLPGCEGKCRILLLR
jgi:hypothetical protein